MRTKSAWRVVLLVSVAALAALMGFFVIRWAQDLRSEQAYEALRAYGPGSAQVRSGPVLASAEHAVTAESAPSRLWVEPNVPEIPIQTNTAVDDAGRGDVDFDRLRDINGDVVAWIRMDGTRINYPVAQASNDTYYLDRSFTGSKSRSGCIFLGSLYAGDFSDFNSVLYGHHMKAGTMFQAITQYSDSGYFGAHRTGTLYTPDGNYHLDVFSAYVADGNGEFQRSGFAGPEDANEFYRTIAHRSQVTAPFVPVWPQKILSLVTCTYEYDNARYVVHARMTPI